MSIFIELADAWDAQSANAPNMARTEALRECADALRMLVNTKPQPVDTTLQPERSPTHRCKICGAFWMRWSEAWSLCSRECGPCCDNVEMGDQIVPLIISDLYAPAFMVPPLAPRFGPAQQAWLLDIPIMQQSVLFAAVRAPDGIYKDHPVKVLLRWYRRCILLSAFDQRALLDPFEPGGGSFTGPFTSDHAAAFCDGVGSGFYWRGNIVSENAQEAFDYMRKVYLRHVDELPHHFQLHFMHAAQIVGVHHPEPWIRDWWRSFYLMIVNDAHLHPETDAEMNLRLSDNDAEWRSREEVTAK